jgi:hypothetical protein
LNFPFDSMNLLRVSEARTGNMGTLTEIEAAADRLPEAQQQELLLFLAARLRAKKMPLPRKFTREQIQEWIARDEAEMRAFDEGQ